MGNDPSLPTDGVIFIENPTCGSTGVIQQVPSIEVNCPKPLQGRYVTFQRTEPGEIVMMEAIVHVTGQGQFILRSREPCRYIYVSVVKYLVV